MSVAGLPSLSLGLSLTSILLVRGEGVTPLGERVVGREGEGVEGTRWLGEGDARTMSNVVCEAWSTKDWARRGINVAAAMAAGVDGASVGVDASMLSVESTDGRGRALVEAGSSVEEELKSCPSRIESRQRAQLLTTDEQGRRRQGKGRAQRKTEETDTARSPSGHNTDVARRTRRMRGHPWNALLNSAIIALESAFAQVDTSGRPHERASVRIRGGEVGRGVAPRRAERAPPSSPRISRVARLASPQAVAHGRRERAASASGIEKRGRDRLVRVSPVSATPWLRLISRHEGIGHQA